MPSIPLRLESNLGGHVSYVARGTAGMEVTDAADLLTVHSGLASDTFNIACRARLASASADHRIREVIESFTVDGKRVPFAWWIGPTCAPPDLAQRLGRHGLLRTEVEIGMAMQTGALEPLSKPTGVGVRRARTRGDVADYARVLAALSEPADESFLAYFERAAPRILQPRSPMRLYVAYLDGQPVGGSEVFVENGVAGIYGVATVPRARRQGIGLMMTAVPLYDARAEGATLAVLQASPEGTKLYARLGFDPCGEFAIYQLRT